MDQLLTHLRLKTRLIQALVRKLRELRYPTRTPLLLAGIIERIACALCDDMWAQAAGAPADDNSFRIQLKLSVKAIESLTAQLRFVERATTQLTPWSLIQPLEKVSEALHPGCRFLIRPQWTYSFTILELISRYKKDYDSLPIEQIILESLAGAESDEISSLYVVGFPYLERLSVLRHVLFGHEIGHPIENEYFKNNPEALVNRRMDVDVDKEPLTTSATDLNDLFNLKDRSNMARAVRAIRHRALAEIICDMVCVRLFGPAALFALFDFCQTSDLDSVIDEPPQRHYPPWRYRLRNAAELISDEWFESFLREGKFEPQTCQALKIHLEKIRNAVKVNSDLEKLNAKPATRIAYHYVLEALPNARRFVDDRMNGRNFSMDNLIGATHSLLLRQLEYWIPPDHYIDEDGTEIHANLFTILNIGWIRFIADFSSLLRRSDSKEQEDHFQGLESMNRLLLKAVENTTVRDVWKLHHLSNP